MKIIKDIEIKNWSDFEPKLQELYSECSIKVEDISLRSHLLFRGQSDSGWKLQTTLDRYADDNISLFDYYRIIYAAKPQIETFTGQTWDIPSRASYKTWSENFDMYILDKPMAYEYMAYLRHHGFPSPLLDWTSSPYLAAFFAFDGVVETEGTDHVAIYVYLADAGEGRSSSSSYPWITTLGPYVKTHRRHFLQQSRYTACKVIKVKEKKVFYASHEDALSDSEEKQDIIWRFIIPKKERFISLKKLESMNINAYSLFGSEESLMRTIALREFELRKMR